MNRFAFFGIFIFSIIGFNACSDNASNASSTGESSSTDIEETSSSSENFSSSLAKVSSSSGNNSSSAETESCSSVENVSSSSIADSSAKDTSTTSVADTTKNVYSLKAFEGPLANPHKGFTVPTGGAWTFVPEFQYGPYGELKNGAWDLVTYGSGHQQWNKLNPQKGVYNWTELEKLLDACYKNGLTYALRVFPYSPSFIKANDTPEENYDWTPAFVYEMGAKKIKAKLTTTGYYASVPVWDDPTYIQAAKDFAAALAAKYDGDPRIEYIDIRSFGEWGEWHASHLEGSEMPNDSIQIDMLNYYASLFKKTLLVLPSNGHGDVYTHALKLGIAKRDDGFIGTPGRPDSLVRAYVAGVPTIAENISEYATMLEYNDIIPGGYLKWTPERWVNAITTAHLTYYVLDQGNDCGYKFYQENKALADSMTHVIGYNFSVSKAEFLTIAKSAETTNVLNITVKNTGIAPCFFDIYMVAEFVDSAGIALEQLGETMAIPKGSFKDGMAKEFSFATTIPAKLTNVATLPGVTLALSIYESEDAFKEGLNPTVRFDNDGILENKKLLLK